MVGRAHPAAPGRRSGRRTAQGAPLSSTTPGSCPLHGRRGALREVLPAPRRAPSGRVDARLPDRLLDAGVAGGRARPRRASSSFSATRSSASISLTHQLATSRAPLVHRDIQGAFQRGLYAPQFQRVLDAFPGDQVFIGQYEACRADPAREAARTFAFLGLAPFEPDAAAYRGEVNPTTGPRFEPSASLREALVEAYAPDLEQLPSLVPALDLSLWTTARELGLA